MPSAIENVDAMVIAFFIRVRRDMNRLLFPFGNNKHSSHDPSATAPGFYRDRIKTIFSLACRGNA
jgi:hypothetical protein